MSVWTQDARSAYRSYLRVVCLQSIPLSLTGALITSYLTLYATDVLLIAPAIVGTLFALARLYDGVTDVLIGWWSDQRSGPGGRRRPFLLAGTLSMIPFAFLRLPPEGLQGLQLILFFGLALLLFESLSTLVLVPFNALGIESARTPRERSFATALSRAIGVAGLIAGFAVMQVLINSEAPRAEAGPYIMIITVLSMLALGAGALQVQELRLAQPSPARNPWRQLRDVFSLGYFRQYTLIYCASWFCFA
ncbi:MAG: MFS transporter, partial [Pseudomonadota bacterium]